MPTDPPCRILPFPADPFAPPPRITWREWARLEIAALRARRAGNDSQPQLEPENRSTGLETPPRASSDAGQVLMRELTPPVQTDEERGQGDSTNARLHRLLRR